MYKTIGKAIEFSAILDRYARYPTTGSSFLFITYNKLYFRSVVELNVDLEYYTDPFFLIDVRDENFRIYYEPTVNILTCVLRDAVTGIYTYLEAGLSDSIKRGPFVISVLSDGSYCSLAINGFHMDSKPGPSSVRVQEPLCLGCDTTYSYPWNGAVDDTILHNDIPDSVSIEENYYELFEPADVSKYEHVWNMEDEDPNWLYDKGTSSTKLDLEIVNNAPYVDGLCVGQRSISRSQLVSSGLGAIGKFDYFFAVLRNTPFIFAVKHPKKFGIGVNVFWIWPQSAEANVMGGKIAIAPEEFYFRDGVWILNKIFPDLGTYYIEFYSNQEGVLTKIHLDVVDELLV